LGMLDLFLLKERAVLQAEMQKLQAENSELLRENRELLQQKVSNHASLTVIRVDSEKTVQEPDPKDELVSALLEKVQHYQRFLAREREASKLRETNFTQSLHILQKTVKDTVKSCSQEHLRRSSYSTTTAGGGPTTSAETALDHHREPAMDSGKDGGTIVDRVMKLTKALSQRADEMKHIRKLAEEKAQQATRRIAELERKTHGLSILQAHSNQVDLELDVLKLRLKKLESAALEYVPLAEQDMLLDFEACKDEVLKVQTRQKQRKKKEDHLGLWRTSSSSYGRV